MSAGAKEREREKGGDERTKQQGERDTAENGRWRDGGCRMRQPERPGYSSATERERERERERETFSFLLSFIFILETDRVPVQIAFRPAYLAVAPRAHIFN